MTISVIIMMSCINLFHATDLFLYPMFLEFKKETSCMKRVNQFPGYLLEEQAATSFFHHSAISEVKKLQLKPKKL